MRRSKQHRKEKQTHVGEIDDEVFPSSLVEGFVKVSVDILVLVSGGGGVEVDVGGGGSEVEDDDGGGVSDVGEESPEDEVGEDTMDV